jgi:hypothetical protein
MAELKTATESTVTPSAPPTSPATSKKKSPGLAFRRLFSKPGVSPYSEVEWELRLAQTSKSPKTGP